MVFSKLYQYIEYFLKSSLEETIVVNFLYLFFILTPFYICLKIKKKKKNCEIEETI